jgi:hypothetical protein
MQTPLIQAAQELSMRWFIHRAVVIVLGLAAAGIADAQSRPRRSPNLDAAASTFPKTTEKLIKPTPPPLAAPPVGETTAFSKRLAEAVNKAAPVADADLSVLRTTTRTENGRTFVTVMIQCDPLRGFAGTRTLTFSRSFQRGPTNPDAARNSGPINTIETVATFRLPSLRPGELKVFEIDATSAAGEELRVAISPGDRNRANDSRSIRVPVR